MLGLNLPTEGLRLSLMQHPKSLLTFLPTKGAKLNNIIVVVIIIIIIIELILWVKHYSHLYDRENLVRNCARPDRETANHALTR